jgi:hypothetical protein
VCRGGSECLEPNTEGDLHDESLAAVVAGRQVSAKRRGGRGGELAVGEYDEVSAEDSHGFLRARIGCPIGCRIDRPSE